MPPGHAVNNGGSGRCLDDETLALLLEGELDADEDEDVRAHLDTCNACRTLFAEAARSADSGIKGAKPKADPPVRRGKVLTYVTLEPGDVVAGKYRVERRIGVGGMGYVLAARHVDLDQMVALKVMRPEMLADTDAVRRFAREAKSAASLHSEHAVRIFDVGRLETGTPYIVMEYLEGFDLSSLLDKEGPLPIATAIDYLLQVCEALAEAHELGIIHRDLKPHNMFLTRDRSGAAFVKVLDFGLAKATSIRGEMDSAMTGTNVMLGSPFFMSPEQVHSTRDVDHRSDIWSLGATLYHLVAGVPPFLAPNVHLVCARILTEDFPPLHKRRADAPPELEALLRRCMARTPDQRYASVGELMTALRAVRDVVVRGRAPSIDTGDVAIVSDPSMDGRDETGRDETTIAKQAFRRTETIEQDPTVLAPLKPPLPRGPPAAPVMAGTVMPVPVMAGPVMPVPVTAMTKRQASARSGIVLGVIGMVAVVATFVGVRMKGGNEKTDAGAGAVIAVTATATAASATVPSAMTAVAVVTVTAPSTSTSTSGPSTSTSTSTSTSGSSATASNVKGARTPLKPPPRPKATAPEPSPYDHP